MCPGARRAVNRDTWSLSCVGGTGRNIYKLNHEKDEALIPEH